LKILAASLQNTVFILFYFTHADSFNLSPVLRSTSISWLHDVMVKEVNHNQIAVRIKNVAVVLGGAGSSNAPLLCRKCIVCHVVLNVA